MDWKEEEHLVPIIFRPFNEHNCPTFWWGRRNLDEPERMNMNTTEEEYIALWQFTVTYLRNVAQVHNLLYAYSPDTRCLKGRDSDATFPDLDSFEATYYYGYPGDDYVDVLGLDFYQDLFPRGLYDVPAVYKKHLEMLVLTAHDRSDMKIPALTETGGQWWPDDDWWTTFLYPALVGTRSTRSGQVAWVLVWRNWDDEHRHGPYPGGSSAADFAEFKNHPAIHFEDEIPLELYAWP